MDQQSNGTVQGCRLNNFPQTESPAYNSSAADWTNLYEKVMIPNFLVQKSKDLYMFAGKSKDLYLFTYKKVGICIFFRTKKYWFVFFAQKSNDF